MPSDTLTITDNRTGKRFELAIEHETIRAIDLRQMKTDNEDFGLITYDPGYMNTGSCRSRITYIDGDKGILRYRGYPIEQLAEHSTHLETSWLILNGELPSRKTLHGWENEIVGDMAVHENFKAFMSSFRHDAHPMGMVQSAIAALGTFHPSSKKILDREERQIHIRNLIAKVPTLAAYAYRHNAGLPYVGPDSKLSYTGNFLNMMFTKGETRHRPHQVLERALDVLFILHADHEQNCSTSTMRMVGSAQTDPYASLSGAAAALYGPLHGGANEAVLNMLREIGTKDNIPKFIEGVKAGHGRLMGFGHRVYKNYDPRARIVKRSADEVFDITGRNPLIEVAVELERIALEDEYFVKRKLYPNVDFYSGIIYEAMGFPTEMFTVLFTIARTVGWLAQWEEMLNDNDQKIARPRQVYLGEEIRDYVPAEKRP
ncbi:MAG TPA: citrate synthase [Bryobacteraceae bacterium]|jgi:citrate synthase|nr:citrate synthase [Bryobacteraceae bacterium]